MAIIYIHGVAVRDQAALVDGASSGLLGRLLENITWEMVEGRLRHFVAPAISKTPTETAVLHAYWGDLGAHLAWDGASCLPGVAQPAPRRLTRRRFVTELRPPLNQLGAQFFGDVMCYLNFRGNASQPGPIPLRMLDALSKAQAVKEETGEPIIVLSNSMGGQIMYDVVTHFLPRLPQYSSIHVDFWCSVAAQIGLFEELKLFLASSPEYGKAQGNRVPFPDRKHLGTWWNVWDVADVISYSVHDIIEGVDDTPFDVRKPLFEEHIGYLQQDAFYSLFAQRLRQALGQ